MLDRSARRPDESPKARSRASSTRPKSAFTRVFNGVATAVINKRAGGTGLISGRKAFQRPMTEGVKLLNTIQDVYLSPEVTVA
jgi:DhnA family fructose-bisphosphate aldolase class Ia